MPKRQSMLRFVENVFEIDVVFLKSSNLLETESRIILQERLLTCPLAYHTNQDMSFFSGMYFLIFLDKHICMELSGFPFF